jgi:hypothetical protein
MFNSHYKQLKDRWSTPQGRKLLERLVSTDFKNNSDWQDVLSGFPHVEEVRSGRDLRGVDLSNWQNLAGGNFILERSKSK